MARLEFGVPVQLEGQVWFLSFKGLGLQQDVVFEIGGQRINASRGELKHSGLDSIWQLNADATIFHLDIAQLSQEQAIKVFIDARETTFVSWSLRNPLGVEYQIDGFAVSRGNGLEVLEIRQRSQDSLQLTAKNHLPGIEPESNQDSRLPLLVREAQVISKSLALGAGFQNVVAVVDTTASMREQLGNGTVHRVLEAIRGVASSISMAPFQLFFAGIPLAAEVWATTDIPSLAIGFSSRFAGTQLCVPQRNGKTFSINASASLRSPKSASRQR